MQTAFGDLILNFLKTKDLADCAVGIVKTMKGILENLVPGGSGPPYAAFPFQDFLTDALATVVDCADAGFKLSILGKLMEIPNVVEDSYTLYKDCIKDFECEDDEPNPKPKPKPKRR
ncbi:MAG: hypothetical protein IPM98_06330 [Lewinellaceae bacterium]|nr:hypothetical protein [Lewinellaceae bacterium]